VLFLVVDTDGSVSNVYLHGEGRDGAGRAAKPEKLGADEFGDTTRIAGPDPVDEADVRPVGIDQLETVKLVRPELDLGRWSFLLGSFDRGLFIDFFAVA